VKGVFVIRPLKKPACGTHSTRHL